MFSNFSRAAARRGRVDSSRKRALRRLFTEQLETRQMLAADVYVDNVSSNVISGGYAGDYLVTNDQGVVGTLDAGDTVTWQPSTPAEVTGLTFGVDAFSALPPAVAAVDVGGEVHVAPGTFVTVGQLNLNKSLTLSGAGQDATVLERAGVPVGTEDRAIEIQASNVTISSLTLDGWDTTPSNAEVGNGYLAWTTANFTTFDDVHFQGDDNRVAVYLGTQNDFTVTDSRFTGTFFRAAIRGAGERMTIRGNSFEESHYWYSPIYMEYGAPTSGVISYNYFASRVGVNNDVYGEFKSDGTGLYAITNFQPDKTTGDGLVIEYNTFQFQDSDLVNELGNKPIPQAVYIDPLVPASGPITIRDNIFDGYAYTGPQPATQPSWQPSGGVFGGALEFDGVDDFAVFQSALFDIGAAGTANFWVKMDDAGRRNQFFEGPGNAGFEIQYRPDTGGQVYSRTTTVGGDFVIRSGPDAATMLNNWVNVQVTWDIAGLPGADGGGKMRVYLNGVESSYLTNSTPTDLTWASAVSTVNGLMNIGRDAGDPSRAFDGMMDDVGFFNAPLSAADRTSIRNSGVAALAADSRLVAHWDLDQSSGDIAIDNKNSIPLYITTDGIVPFGPEFRPALGKFGGALEFDGVDDFATFKDPSFDVGEKGTVSFWVKMDNTTRRNQFIEGPDNAGFEVQYRTNSSGQVYGRVTTDNDFVIRSGSDSTTLNAGWTNIQVIYDFNGLPVAEGGGKMRIYLNGVESTYLSGLTPTDLTWAGVVNTVDKLMYVGRDLGDASRSFDGMMDDVAWFNDVLSSIERSAIRATSVGASALNNDSRLVAYWDLDDAPGTTVAPGDGGTSISLYVQAVPPPPAISGYAVNAPAGTVVTNNLFHNNDVNYNAQVNASANLIGDPLFDEGVHFAPPISTDEYYALEVDSPAVNAGSGFPNPTQRHIGAYQGIPLPAANTVFVNEDWAGTPFGTDPDGAGPAIYFGVDSFATIQDGIDLVADDGTVVVLGNDGAGYAGFTLDRELTLSFIEDYQFPAETTVTIDGVVVLQADSDWNLGDGTIKTTAVNPADFVLAATASIDADVAGSYTLEFVSVTDGLGDVDLNGPIGGAASLASIVLGAAGNRFASLTLNSDVEAGTIAASTKDGLTVTSNGDLDALSASIALIAGGDLTIAAGGTVDAATTISLAVDAGGDDPGVGGTAALNGVASSGSGTTLVGGPDVDTIQVTRLGLGGLSIDGAGSGDAISVALGAAAGATIASSITLDDNGVSGVDTLTVTTGANADSLVIDAASLTRGVDAISFGGDLEELYVASLDSDDVVDVTPSTTTKMFLDGGNPVPPVLPLTGDHLIFNALGGVVNDTGSVLTRSGYQPVSYVDFERLTINNAALVIDGDDGLDDVLTVTATGVDDGSYVLTTDGVPGPTVVFTNIASLFFDGKAGNDKLVILNQAGGVFAPAFGITYTGGLGNDQLDVVGGSASTGSYTPGPAADAGTLVQTNAPNTQSISFTGLEPIVHTTAVGTFTVNGTSGVDTINVVNGTVEYSVQTVEVNFNGAFELIKLANKTTLNVATVGSSDVFNVDYTLAPAGVSTLDLQGGNGDDVFNVLDSTPAGLTTRLSGGANNDQFVFSDGKVLAGQAAGGGGSDQIDLSAYTTAATISLTANGASGGFNGAGPGSGTFTEIEQFVGGSASDTFRQDQNVATAWNISADDAGTVQVASPSARSATFSSFEKLVGASGANDAFMFADGTGLTGTLDARGGNGVLAPLSGDSLDYTAFTTGVSVNLTAGTASNIAGGILTDAGGSSIEHLYGTSLVDTLTGDADVNQIRGFGGNDTINAKAGADDVDGGLGSDVIQVEAAEAEFDLIQGGPGGVGDATDYDLLINIGESDVTLNAFNAAYDVFANSIDEYNGAGYGILGNGNGNELHFGFAKLTDVPGLNSGDDNDDVTTSYSNNAGDPTNVAYDGGDGIDHVTLVFTPDQLGALTTDDILDVQAYLQAPTGQTLFLPLNDLKGNFTATNFESAHLAVYDDDVIINITACFLAVVSEDQIIVGTNDPDPSLIGTPLVDLIFGQDGNDVISGLAANDCLFGGRDQDTITGASGADLILGGSGHDSISGGIDADLIYGGLGNDTLFGDQANDTIYGGAGNDSIRGGADEDSLYGGDGVDSIYGELGHDQIWGEADADYLEGNEDNDTLNGGADNDSVYGNAGVDKIQVQGIEGQFDVFNGGTQFDDLEIIGGASAAINGFSLATNNVERILGNGQGLLGNANANVFNLTGITFTTLSPLAFINGLEGNDQFTGSEFNDWFIGGEGNDTLIGNGGADILEGNAGIDVITGGNGNDTIDGGADGDSLQGEGGNDIFRVRGDEMRLDTVVNGGANTDRIVNVGVTPVTIAGFNAVAQAFEYWEGNNQPILGTNVANVFDFRTSATASNTYSSSAVVFVNVPYVDALDGNDVIYGTNGIDDLRGGLGNDSIYGMHGDDKLSGGAGTDTLNGGAGIDTLDGGDGVDTLSGDAGNDYFVFADVLTDNDDQDVITDYSYDFINLQAYALAYGTNYANTLFAGNTLTLSTTPAPQKKIVLTGVASKPSATKFLF
ncbi:MAG: LamG-like jellyroll fold domain-containing protein [Pirellulales bacterium]